MLHLELELGNDVVQLHYSNAEKQFVSPSKPYHLTCNQLVVIKCTADNLGKI